MSELKPCPFCGGEAAYTQILGNYGRPHEVYWMHAPQPPEVQE